LTVETDSVPQQVQDPVESADLVVSILAEFDADFVAKAYDALRALPGPLRIAVVDNDQGQDSAPANSEAAEKSAPEEGVQKNAAFFYVSSPLTRADGNTTGVFRLLGAYQSVFAVTEKLNARGCCVIASKRETVTPECVWQLAQPLFEGEVDLVLPHYTRRRFNGLLTNSIIAPLIRALYGKRVNNPMGPDFAASRRLIQTMLATKAGGNTGGGRRHPLASLAPTALCENLCIKEVHCGARVYPPTDWTGMSSVLAEFLSPVFLDMERNAPCWQRTRISSAVQAIGEPAPMGVDTATVDTGRLVESFQLGNRELQEIWGLVLPPSTLFELKKLARLPVEQFRMPDELWVRIVYDFCLAHRLRTISRDHLLKSMTPLYLGWVASYAQDLKASGAATPEGRLERLSLAYEAGKSYLVSRWRWPDRFNP
jgi:glucosylglycerate synthase